MVAAAHSKKPLEINPRNVYVWDLLARCLKAMGDERGFQHACKIMALKYKATDTAGMGPKEALFLVSQSSFLQLISV
jgi:hypothetical protein